MVGISVGRDTEAILLVGHGLIIPEPYEIASGLTLVEPPEPRSKAEIADATDHLSAYVAVLDGQAMQHFAIRIEGEAIELAQRAWNALWTFHLLSLAVSAPVWPLYAVSVQPTPAYSLANRQLCLPVNQVQRAGSEKLTWAKEHKALFDALVTDSKFSVGMRAFGNSQGLLDADLRIMLLWSGIDAILCAPETRLRETLSRRASHLLAASDLERSDWYQYVKRNYQVRNKAVHGAVVERNVLKSGKEEAERILIALLRTLHPVLTGLAA
ncbi:MULTISPECIES: HEPN domain-containing protein [unclassified Sinorhizobium]|uniref:HEPN domain-containing protein n=1 Tax=unclassified Sinorhizobium TaxID=2613772 RepID=UPI0024C27BD9|nr:MULTISPECIES: HEPN domain-containing protein [unclassified Sinorhizobium]MDK1378188.1 HEPN domain-containing protein [Sinorhizobium sp. 6-70]MDK1479763.1 HEPN domain-containing protein [Sinorhizobium sp. 6-117]